MDWKQIDEYDYFVSNTGLVRNKRGMILKPTKDKGYIRVNLCKNKEKKKHSVHRLVALAFIPNPDNKPQVDHADSNPSNNDVSNLRWATRSENTSNRRKREGVSSIYKGVRFYKGGWTSTLKKDGKANHLGFYKTEREAGQAYNNYILENHLEQFYQLNNL
jgi:hypothetical protein